MKEQAIEKEIRSTYLKDDVSLFEDKLGKYRFLVTNDMDLGHIKNKAN